MRPRSGSRIWRPSRGGGRANDPVGYGLVVGLAGAGDSLRSAPFTEKALSNLLERLGVNAAGETFRPKNIAAVLATAKLPPFSRTVIVMDQSAGAIVVGGDIPLSEMSLTHGAIKITAERQFVASQPTPRSPTDRP